MEITKEEYEKLSKYKKISELSEYAQEYWNNLTNFITAGSLRGSKLPIIFDEEYILNDAKELTTGVIHENILKNGRTMIYIIICSDKQLSNDYIKKAIRHEAIHFALRVQSLKSQDNSAVFKIIADLFQGSCYMELDGIEKDIYEIGKQTANETAKMIKEKPKDLGLKLCFAMLLDEIGNPDYKNKEDLDKLKYNIRIQQQGIELHNK